MHGTSSLESLESVVTAIRPATPSNLDDASPNSGRVGTLAAVALQRAMRVVELRLESDLADWLRAVGIGVGDEVIVLRRAAFGGPLHVRTRSGGEFAIHRSLAECIVVRACERDVNVRACERGA